MANAVLRRVRIEWKLQSGERLEAYFLDCEETQLSGVIAFVKALIPPVEGATLVSASWHTPFVWQGSDGMTSLVIEGSWVVSLV